ncbi:protein CUSTOS isoform X2 [Mustelus asterias]
MNDFYLGVQGTVPKYSDEPKLGSIMNCEEDVERPYENADSVISVNNSEPFLQQQVEDDDEDFRLFSTSIPGDLGIVESLPPVRQKPPPSSSDSDSEWERLKEAAVSSSDILQQSSLLSTWSGTSQAKDPIEAEDEGKGKQEKKKKKKKKRKRKRNLVAEGEVNLVADSSRKGGEQVSREAGFDSSSTKKSKQMCKAPVSGLGQIELVDGTPVGQGYFGMEQADLERRSKKKKKGKHKNAKYEFERVDSNSYQTKKNKVPATYGP